MVLQILHNVPGGIRLSCNILIFNMNSECFVTDAGNVSSAIFFIKLIAKLNYCLEVLISGLPKDKGLLVYDFLTILITFYLSDLG